MEFGVGCGSRVVQTVREQIIGRHAESIGDVYNDIQAGFLFGKFDIANVFVSNSNFFSQSFLRDLFGNAKTADPLAKQFVVYGHDVPSFPCPHKTYQYYLKRRHIATCSQKSISRI